MDINIRKVIAEVIHRYNFLGEVFASVQIIPDYNCYEYHGNPSMLASRKKIFYHPDFVASLNREQLIFAFAHEGCHILLKHLERAKGKDPKLWNTAADAIINAQLKKDHFELIEGCVDRIDAIDYSTEQYYQKLLEEKKNFENNSSNSNQENENYKKYEVGHDTHSNWYTDEKELEEREKSNSDSSDNKNSNEHNQKSEEQSQNKQKGTSNEEKFDDVKVFQENRRAEKQRLEKLRKNLVENMLLAAGKNTNSNSLTLGFVGDKTNIIKWQKLLIDDTKIEEDWSFLNATIEDGVVVPHLEEQPNPETEILIDTSGSVSNNLVKNFLRECKSLLQTSKIRVGCFDTQFYGFQDIQSEEDIDNFTIIGRGGTDFNVAVNSFSGRAENKIIFTDGASSMPDKELNAIWIVYDSGKINPKGGRVIYISQEQLQELNLVEIGKAKR